MISRKLAIAAAFTVFFGGPAQADKLSVVPGNEASREAFQVNKRVQWQSDLKVACEQAKATNRLVFWVHMLGSMEGAT